MSFKILGTGSYAPEHVVTNDDLSALVDTNDEWITQRIGVRSRHISETETNVDMAVKAAERALENAGISADELDLIIATTITGDTLSPGTGCMVQNRIGAHCPAFDLAAACSGFLFALQCASAMLEDGQCALIIGAENLSKVIDWTDRGTSILFGDGAGAMIIRKGAQGKESWHFARSKGDPNRVLDIPGKTLSDVPCRNVAEHYRYLSMDGREVFRFAVGAMQEAIEEVLKRAGKTIDEADLIIPHQANIRILAAVARHMGLPMERFFVNLDEFGNTSAASVPIAFAQAMEQGRLSKGMNVILVGFGGGLTYGASWLEL